MNNSKITCGPSFHGGKSPEPIRSQNSFLSGASVKYKRVIQMLKEQLQGSPSANQSNFMFVPLFQIISSDFKAESLVPWSKSFSVLCSMDHGKV